MYRVPKSIILIYCFFAVCPLFSITPLLEINFDRDRSVALGDKVFPLNGDGIETLSDGRKAMLFGRRNALTLPLAGKIGESGTIVLEFALKPFPPFKHPARPMLTIGTRGRMKIGLSTSAADQPPILQYYVRDTIHNMNYNSSALQFDRIYTAALSFDGNKVRCYLDGVLVHEAPQPAVIKAEDWRNLFIGAYHDGWLNITPWEGGTMVKSLRLYNFALSAGEIAEISGFKTLDISMRHPEVLTIPRSAASSIQADGELKEESWKNAASFLSLVDLVNPGKSWRIPEHHVKFFYDEQNLYIGFDSVFPSGTEIKKGSGPENGEKEVWGSESFELYFFHDSKLYRFAGNVGGGRTESLNNNKDYNPDWQYRSTTRMRIDDTTLWQGEIVIPWKSIGLKAPPTEGIQFNFCRTWMLKNDRIISSLSRPGKGYDDIAGYMLLKPAERTPVIQILSHNDPSYGNLEQKLSLLSNADINIVCRIAMENHAGLMTPETVFFREISLKKDIPHILDVNATLQNSNADCLVFSLTDKQEKQTYLQQILPVKISPDYLTAIPLFSQEKLLVKYRKAQIEAKYGKNFSGHIVLSGPDGKTLTEKTGISDLVELPFSRNNRPGTYKIELRGTNAKNVISAVSFHFPGFGEWSKQTFDNRIIPPFIPLTAKDTGTGTAVSVWGRTYGFDKDKFLPRSMISQSKELFSAPAALRINGRDVSVGAATTWNKAEPHRIEFSSQTASDSYRISGSHWIEYDGIAYFTVKIEALKDLKNIELSFTLPRKIGKYLHAAAGPWGTKITDMIREGKREIPYYPVIYLGNEEKGFCFFAESRHSWPEKSSRPISISATEGNTELVVKLASELKQGKSFQFEFGLLATPVKKLPDNYPLNTIGGYSELNRPGRTPTTYATFTAWLSGQTHGDCLGNLPPENNPILKQYQKETARIHGFGAKAFPYAMSCRLSNEYPEVAAFNEEWKVIPTFAYPYEKNGRKFEVYSLCPTTLSNDFYISNLRELLSKVKLDGIYFDFGLPDVCNNQFHGCCERTPILAYREYLRRVALCLLDSGVKNYVIVLHNTDYVQLPACTFATHLFNGEHIRQSSSSLLHNGKDILDSYPLAMFAVELNSMPFGLTNSAYLPADVLAKKFGGGREDGELYSLRMTRAMLAGMLVHNSVSALNRCHHGIFDKITRIYTAFGVPKATFYGYYRPENPATVLEGKDVYASVYRHASDNRLLAVISHLGNERRDQTVRIRFSPEKLGMKPFSKAVEKIDAPDPEYDELFKLRQKNGVPSFRAPLKWQSGGAKIIEFKNNVLTLELKAHTFALVILE